MTGVPTANPDVPYAVLLVVQVLLGAAAVFGSFGNIMTLLAVLTTKKLQTIPNAYLVNLAILDLTVCSILIPVNILSFHGQISLPVCSGMGYIALLCLVLSVCNLGMVATNRYIMICRKRELYTRIYTQRNVGISIAAMWIIAAVCFSPAFYGFGHFGYNIKFGACLFDAPDEMTYWFVFVFADSVVMFPVIFITLFCYLKILMVFRASRLRVAAQPTVTTKVETNAPTSEPSVDVATAHNAPAQSSNQYNKKKEKESKRKEMAVIKNLFTIWVTFMSCWVPIIIAYKVDFSNIVPAALMHVLFCMAQCNSAFNSIIYCITNRQFRQAYLRLFTCGKKGND